MTIQWIELDVAQADRPEVARKLLAAASDHTLVRSLSAGFRVPYAVAREAGLLGQVAEPGEGKEKAAEDKVEGQVTEPTPVPEVQAVPEVEVTEPTPAPVPEVVAVETPAAAEPVAAKATTERPVRKRTVAPPAG